MDNAENNAMVKRTQMAERGGRRTGFTLIEVLIAIAIVVMLIGLVAVNVLGKKDEAKVSTCKIEIATLESALDQFNLSFDRYPTEDEGLAALWDREALDVEDEVDEEKWSKFVKKPKPTDPWGSEWGYRGESDYDNEYDLWSNGPDKEEGTDDDIANWSDDDDEGLGPASGTGGPAGG